MTNVTKVTIPLIGLLLLTACAGSPTPNTPSVGKPVVAPVGQYVALAYNPADESLDLADQRGLSRWRDGRWSTVALPRNIALSAVAVDSVAPYSIFAAGPGLGVIRSDDGGASWKDVNAGLPNMDVTALALHSDMRDILYVWLKGDGIYRSESNGAYWTRMPDKGPADKDVRSLVHSALGGSMNTGWLYASTPTGAYLTMDCF